MPAMADNMRVSSDGLEYLFRLREGVRWSDGEPVTAEDFVYAWTQIREERAITAFLLEDIESATALDDRTLEVRLREPRSYFPYILASTWAYPRPKHACEELGDAWRKPENLVSNGPFVLAELNDDGALLVANPHFVGPRGNVKEIAITFARGRSATTVKEWIDGPLRRPARARPARAATPRTRSPSSCPSSRCTYVGFRAGPAAVLERARAQGVLARDRPEAAEAGAAGLVTAAVKGGAIPPAMPGHSHRVAPTYDPELAAQAPRGRRLSGGQGAARAVDRRVELESTSPTRSPTSGARCSARASRCGRSRATSGARTSRTTAHMWLSGWTADYPDPDGFFRGLFSASGWPFYMRRRDRGALRARPRSREHERADAPLPRARPALGVASAPRSCPSSTAARCWCGARGSRICGRRRSRGSSSTRSSSGAH